MTTVIHDTKQILLSVVESVEAYLHEYTSSLTNISGIDNLNEQHQSVEKSDDSHPIVKSLPDIKTRLRYKLNKCFRDELSVLRTKASSMRTAYDQMRTSYAKCNSILLSIEDIGEASTSSECYPSISDMCLWIHSMTCSVSADYYSRQLLVQTLSASGGINPDENTISARWKLNIEELRTLVTDVKAYCKYVLEDST